LILMSTMEEVFDKTMKILKRELSSKEFLTFLQAITPKSGDSVKELEEKTKNLTMDDFLKLIKKVEEELKE